MQWKHIQRGIAIISVIAAILSLVIPYYQSVNSNIVFAVNILSNDQLTQMPKIDGLQASYIFNGQPVADLWRSEIELINSGKKTIIGRGTQKNIISENLKFDINPDFNLLYFEVVNNDLAPDDTISKNMNSILVGFSQWRSGQVIKLKIYAERKIVGNSTRGFVELNKNQIIDGEVEYNTQAKQKAETSLLLKDYLPEPIGYSVRILAVIIISVFALIVGAILVSVAFGDSNVSEGSISVGLDEMLNKASVARYEINELKTEIDNKIKINVDEAEGEKIKRIEFYKNMNEVLGNIEKQTHILEIEKDSKGEKSWLAQTVGVVALLIVEVALLGAISWLIPL